MAMVIEPPTLGAGPAEGQPPPPPRPARGFGHYLRDMVYGALDGVITTLAVVTGAAGAHLEWRIGVILGLANLVADGLSMGASNYLALKSELEQTRRSVAEEAPWRHGLATAASFAVAGSLPLVAYPVSLAFAVPVVPVPVVPVAVVLAAVGLIAAGAVRAPFVRKPVWISAGEMFLVGLAAATAAYGVGAATERLLR
jgi:VIT1/CCC1 family predicted Fe2+/Mn2+ transporter